MIYDLSPPISPALRVWPGDTPPSREVLLDMKTGANLTLSSLHATVHLGAHADAPSHYGKDAPSIEARPLDLYIGECQVVLVAARRNTVLRPADVAGAAIRAPRVLLSTGTFPDPGVFNEDFAACSAELVDHLHALGVRLIGIDTPSIDPFPSKELPAHQACLRRDMAVLEGLLLAHVPDGVYELIALPLPLVGYDGSPVRAILRDIA